MDKLTKVVKQLVSQMVKLLMCALKGEEGQKGQKREPIANDSLIKLAQSLAAQKQQPLDSIEGRVAYVVSHGASYASNGYAIRTHAIASALNAQGLEVLCFVRPGRPWELEGALDDIPPEVQLDGVRYIHTRW